LAILRTPSVRPGAIKAARILDLEASLSSNPGSLTMLAAIRRTSSRVSRFIAVRVLEIQCSVTAITYDLQFARYL
jgi:hypothetical protein